MYRFSHVNGNEITAAETEQLKSLWMECFGDSKEYLDDFFEVFLQNTELVIGIDEDAIMSASYLIPLSTNKVNKCYYLYSGGVTERMRGKHIFTEVNSYIVQLIKDAPRFAYSAPHLVDYYKTFLFPTVYMCKEVTLQSSFNAKAPVSLVRKNGDVPEIMDMRARFLDSVICEYVCYPEWFYHMLKREKEISSGVFDIISSGDKKYYIIGRFENDTLVIEETDIPSHLFTAYAGALTSLYEVSTIKIKLPLSDNIPDKESQIVYAGQGSASNNLWAPFALL